MNIFADFNDRIKKAVESLELKGKDGGAPDLSRILVEPPRDASHGDLATNAAMVLAKAAGENPRALAERIAAALRDGRRRRLRRGRRARLRQSQALGRLLAGAAERHAGRAARIMAAPASARAAR